MEYTVSFRSKTLFLLAILYALAAYFLSPALFGEQSLLHGDNIIHAYAFLDFQSQMLHKGGS